MHFKRLKIRNAGLKFFALVLAVMVWQGIRENTRFETQVRNVPVVIDTPEGWAVLDKSTDRVDIVFRGSREDLKDLDRQQVQVRFTVGGDLSVPERVVKLKPRYISTAADARPVYFKPDTIRIRLDERVTRTLPVRPLVQGELPEGIVLDSIACQPEKVRISGPRQRLGAINYVRTERVDLDGHAQSFDVRVPIELPSRLWDASIDPEYAAVSVQIIDRGREVTLDDVPVSALVAVGERAPMEVVPSAVQVVLYGNEEKLDAYRSGVVRAYVSGMGLKGGQEYDLEVRLDVPDGIRVKSIEPQKVKVRFK